jgi:membrane-associated protein
MEHVLELLRGFLVHYGYGAVALTLLLENAGLPVPGETILLLASFLAYSEHHLQLPYIIVVGTLAATVGDNIGFALGHYGGRPLFARYMHLFHVSPRALMRGERVFQRYGAATVFFARFIAGLRVINGPLAGVLRMRWNQFTWFNFLGAISWVTVISCLGYFFGWHWDKLARYVERFDLLLLAVVLLVVFGLWWRWQHMQQPEE